MARQLPSRLRDCNKLSVLLPPSWRGRGGGGSSAGERPLIIVCTTFRIPLRPRRAYARAFHARSTRTTRFRTRTHSACILHTCMSAWRSPVGGTERWLTPTTASTTANSGGTLSWHRKTQRPKWTTFVFTEPHSEIELATLRPRALPRAARRRHHAVSAESPDDVSQPQHRAGCRAGCRAGRAASAPAALGCALVCACLVPCRPDSSPAYHARVPKH